MHIPRFWDLLEFSSVHKTVGAGLFPSRNNIISSIFTAQSQARVFVAIALSLGLFDLVRSAS